MRRDLVLAFFINPIGTSEIDPGHAKPGANPSKKTLYE
jgi:hypothetical protein